MTEIEAFKKLLTFYDVDDEPDDLQAGYNHVFGDDPMPAEGGPDYLSVVEYFRFIAALLRIKTAADMLKHYGQS